MKVINDLVVIQVSKGFSNPTIIRDGSYLQWDVQKGHCVDKLPFPCTIIEVIDPSRPLSCGQIDWMVELAQAESIDHVLSGITYKQDINLLFLKRI